MMIVETRNAGPSLPHPEERRLRRVSKDEDVASWFETAQERLLTMRGAPHRLDSGWHCGWRSWFFWSAAGNSACAPACSIHSYGARRAVSWNHTSTGSGRAARID